MAQKFIPQINLSIRQFYNNATGKHSTHVAARHVIKEGMRKKFFKAIHENKKEFKVTIYYSGDDVIYHVKVPSQSYSVGPKNKIRYDTIFYIKDGLKNRNRKLIDKNCLFFSNSPSFAYVYAYTSKKAGIFYDQYEQKLPGLCLTQPPVLRNPDMVPLGFEWSLTMAVYYLWGIQAFEYLYIDRFAIPANKYNMDILERSINTTDELVQLHQFAEYEYAKKKRKIISNEVRGALERKRNEIQKKEKKLNKLIAPKKMIKPLSMRKVKKAITSTLKNKKK